MKRTKKQKNRSKVREAGRREKKNKRRFGARNLNFQSGKANGRTLHAQKQANAAKRTKQAAKNDDTD
jgi:hypothetical protein